METALVSRRGQSSYGVWASACSPENLGSLLSRILLDLLGLRLGDWFMGSCSLSLLNYVVCVAPSRLFNLREIAPQWPLPWQRGVYSSWCRSASSNVIIPAQNSVGHATRQRVSESCFVTLSCARFLKLCII